jgi:hypothetical protein
MAINLSVGLSNADKNTIGARRSACRIHLQSSTPLVSGIM